MTEREIADHIRSEGRRDVVKAEDFLPDAALITKYVSNTFQKDSDQARKLILESKDFDDWVSKIRTLP